MSLRPLLGPRSERVDRELGEPNIAGPLGALPRGFPPPTETLSFPTTTRGAPVCALSTRVVHVDRSARAIMRPPNRYEPPVHRIIATSAHTSNLVKRLEAQIDAMMEADMESVDAPEEPFDFLEDEEFTAGKSPKQPEDVVLDRYGLVPDEKSVKDFDKYSEYIHWKTLLYADPPDNALSRTLGRDMGFTIRISLIPHHYAPSKYLSRGKHQLKRDHKFRVDIGGFTGGSNTKTMLDQMGRHFCYKLEDKDKNQTFKWLNVVDKGKFFICTSPGMSFYRIVGAVSTSWAEMTGTPAHDPKRGQEEFRKMMLSKVLLGTFANPVDMATPGEPANLKTQVIDIPVSFKDGFEGKWIWTAFEQDYAAVTAVDTEKLAAAEAKQEKEEEMPSPSFEEPKQIPKSYPNAPPPDYNPFDPFRNEYPQGI